MTVSRPLAPAQAGTPTLAQTGARKADEVARIGGLAWPVALYLICLLIPLGFNLGSLAMTTLRVLLLVMIVPITLRLVTGQYGRILATDVFYFLHIGWAGLALAVNNPDQVVQQIGSVGMEFIGGYALGRAYIRTKADFVALIRWLLALVLLLFPFAILETLSGRPLIIEAIRKIPGLSSVTPVTADKRLGLERVQAVFAHPIHFGLFCSVVMSLAFVGLKNRLPLVPRWIGSAIVGLSGFLALSSGAILAILLQIKLYLWSSIFARLRWRWWLLVGLFAVVYVAIDLLSNRTPLRVFMSYATFSAHTAYWRSIIFDWGMVNVWKHPLFGIGLNDWERPDYMYSGSMDNFWLVNAVRYGIPGFLLLAAGYAWSLVAIMARDFRDDDELTQFRRAWVFTFLGLSFTLCTVHIWANIYSFCFFMYGAGMWLLDALPESDPAQALAPAPRPPRETRGRTGGTGPTPALPPRATLSSQSAPDERAPPPKARTAPVYSRFAHKPRRRMAEPPPLSRPPRSGPKRP